MKDNIINSCLIGFEAILTITQTNQIFQLISIILTCISAVVALAYNIYKWYVKAKQDNKIDPKELEELAGIIKDAADNINK